MGLRGERKLSHCGQGLDCNFCRFIVETFPHGRADTEIAQKLITMHFNLEHMVPIRPYFIAQ
jgi:hypothetical protein